jgi:hypothetical protein
LIDRRIKEKEKDRDRPIRHRETQNIHAETYRDRLKKKKQIIQTDRKTVR